MSHRNPVGIIGAGIAGFTAALHLTRAGRPVRLFEARDRIGGRIMTLVEQGSPHPIELGAEFIHGVAEPTLSLMNEVGLGAQAVLDRHCRFARGSFHSIGDMWSRIARLMKGASESIDRSAQEFFVEREFEGTDAELFRLFIEGFEAASLEDVSLRSAADEANGAVDDPAQFRPEGGYGALMTSIERLLPPELTHLALNATVKEVHWKRGGPCALTVRQGDGVETIDVDHTIVTVPVSVLGSSGESSSISFFPRIDTVAGPLSLVAMGHVVKFVLRFRPAAWMDALPKADFIHFANGPFPTVWQERETSFRQITAWAGGPKTKQLEALGTRDKIDQVVEELAEFCKVAPADIRDSILSASHHDFGKDPCSLGAYPHLRPGGTSAPMEFAKPIADAVFFAGDATDPDYFGTVAGAIASGARAAMQILSLDEAA